MALPVWISHQNDPNNERLVYALLDTQSDQTFILDKTATSLGVQGPKVTIQISTMSSEETLIECHKDSGLIVRGYNSEKRIHLPTTYTREYMPANKSHKPSPDAARKWSYLSEIADKLMSPQDLEVSILIGYDCPRALVPREVIPPRGDGPFAQRTDLGWGIVGIVDYDNPGEDPIGSSHRIVTCPVPAGTAVVLGHRSEVMLSLKTATREVISPADIKRIMELDFATGDTNGPNLSRDDQRFLKILQEGIHQDSFGYFEMPLPFKDVPILPDNHDIALKRLTKLQSRFRGDEKYFADHSSFMDKIIENGHAEKVPESELQGKPGHKWYLPYHGVYHPKKPSKIRVVFDGSAQYRGHSLNSHLLQGPELANTLLGVVLRFRRRPLAYPATWNRCSISSGSTRSIETTYASFGSNMARLPNSECRSIYLVPLLRLDAPIMGSRRLRTRSQKSVLRTPLSSSAEDSTLMMALLQWKVFKMPNG